MTQGFTIFMTQGFTIFIPTFSRKGRSDDINVMIRNIKWFSAISVADTSVGTT